MVCITDPVLATYILRSKDFDKIRFIYSFLDPVKPFSLSPEHCQQRPKFAFICLQELVSTHAMEKTRSVSPSVASMRSS